MAQTLNGTSDKISASVVVASPDTSAITMHTVFRPSSLAADRNLVAIDRESGGNGPIVCVLFRASNSKAAAFWRPNNLNAVELAGTTTLSTSAYQSVQARFSPGNGTFIYYNGVADGSTASEATGDSYSNLGGTRMGFLQNGGSGLQFFVGDYGQGAVWAVDLTDAEIAALGKGAHPLTVRPQSLVACVDVIGGRIIDWLKVGFTLTGTTAAVDHPSLLMPVGTIYGAPAAGGTFTGTGAFTLPSLSFSAAGTFPYRGAAAFTLPALTTTAAGTLTFAGTSGFTLPSLSTDAAGSFTEAGAFTGTGAFTLPSLTTAAVGTVTFIADAPFLLPALSTAAAGWATATGEAEFTLPSLNFSATGTGGADGIPRAAPPAGGGSDNRRGERRRRQRYVLPDGRRIWLYPEEIADLVARGRLRATGKPAERHERHTPSQVTPVTAPLALPPVRDRSADIARLTNEARAAGRLAEMVAGMAEGLSAATAAAQAAEDQRRRRRRRAAALLLLQ